MKSSNILPFHKRDETVRTELAASEVLAKMKAHQDRVRDIKDNLHAMQREGKENIHQINEILSSLHSIKADKEQPWQEKVHGHFPDGSPRLQYFHKQADELQGSIEEVRHERRRLTREIHAKGKEIKQYQKVNQEQVYRLRHAYRLLDKSQDNERDLFKALEMKRKNNKQLTHKLRTKNEQLQRLIKEVEHPSMAVSGSQTGKGSEHRNHSLERSPDSRVIHSTYNTDDLQNVKKGGWLGMFGLSWGSKDKETECIEKTEQLTAEIARLKQEMKEHKQLFERVVGDMQKHEQTGRNEAVKKTTEQVKHDNNTMADRQINKQAKKKDTQKNKADNQALSSSGKGRTDGSKQGTAGKGKRKKQPQSGKTFNPSKYLK